jgi:hypothetical protein
MRRFVAPIALASAIAGCGSLLASEEDDPAPKPVAPIDAQGAPDGGPEASGAEIDAAADAPVVLVDSGPHRVFVTQGRYKGSALNLDGGTPDKICAAEGAAAGAGKHWVAWIRTGGQTAGERLPDFGPWSMKPDDKVVATTKATLLGKGTLENPINRSADGIQVSGASTCVWTGAKPDGGADSHCDDWTKDSGNTPFVPSCSSECRIYCFEKP